MFTLDTPAPGFVINAFWTLTGVNGEYTAQTSGNTLFTTQEGTFTPYDQLTETQVIGWVQSALGEEGIAQAQGAVDGQIASEMSPAPIPQTPPLPWAPAA